MEWLVVSDWSYERLDIPLAGLTTTTSQHGREESLPHRFTQQDYLAFCVEELDFQIGDAFVFGDLRRPAVSQQGELLALYHVLEAKNHQTDLNLRQRRCNQLFTSHSHSLFASAYLSLIVSSGCRRELSPTTLPFLGPQSMPRNVRSSNITSSMRCHRIFTNTNIKSP